MRDVFVSRKKYQGPDLSDLAEIEQVFGALAGSLLRLPGLAAKRVPFEKTRARLVHRTERRFELAWNIFDR